jgi:glycerol-3-phosphate dehydrogenase
VSFPSFRFILYYCGSNEKTVNREELIQKMQAHLEQTWDIVVIGGGATGLGIALDAVTRGYRILLLEQSDFTKGTSSRSTKLIHGGVRYLAQGDILLVYEALKERGIILKNSPNLTVNQEFVVPLYSIWDVLLYTTGLKFYDFLAGRLSLGKSKFINRKKTLEKLPLLKKERLRGGVVYHDGQFDDARLGITLAQVSVQQGAVLLNYFRVTGLTKDLQKKICGVKALDLVSGQEYTIKAKLVINATGVFADEICRMDKPGAKPSIRPSQGVHIILDGSFLRSSAAIMIPKTDDGRVLFAIPWYGKVVVGTTDTPLESISLEPKALDEEIGFILKTAGRYLTRKPNKEDILCVFAGLRPLATNPDNPEATREVSRRHKITLSPSGLLSVLGGKWTFYRRMAEETLDKAIKAGILDNHPCVTKDFKLVSHLPVLKNERFAVYGEKAGEIEEIIRQLPKTGESVIPGFPYTKAEIIWICRNEMPVHIEDVLARRTRALVLDARMSEKLALPVAEIMAEEFGYNGQWKQNQLEEYKKLITYYL